MGLGARWSGGEDSGLRARILPLADRVEVWCTATGETIAVDRDVWRDLIEALRSGRLDRPPG